MEHFETDISQQIKDKSNNRPVRFFFVFLLDVRDSTNVCLCVDHIHTHGRRRKGMFFGVCVMICGGLWFQMATGVSSSTGAFFSKSTSCSGD